MRMANRAIIRERHVTPTIEEIIQDLNGATVFSKLDLRSAYNQLELDEDSRSITTFCTHEGLRRYTRLNFRTCSAAEICQNVISQVLSDIPNARNISNDVLVFGRSQADHDAALEAVMKRFRENNLTLNQSKCAFGKSEINFFGLVFSAEGVGPDPKKVAAIKNAPHPNSQAEVRSLLGLASYMSRFIKDFSTITAPLRELTRKRASFKWQPRHQTALDRLKEALTSEDVIAYFDPNKETHLIVDASPVGLGACLAQKVRETKDEYKVVAYASRSLSPTECRYAQTEREALSIVWGIERFSLYLLGAQFTLHTDHRPLETNFNNPKSRPPARIERWLLRLQPYNFRVVYLPGKDNPTDYLSRHPVDSYSLHNCKQAEAYVNFISHFATPKAMSLSEIKRETASDPTMQELAKLIRTQCWYLLKNSSYTENLRQVNVDVNELTLFRNVSMELTVNNDDNVILRNTRLVIPQVLRKRVLALSHIGHMGIEKVKQLLREKVYFPGIDKAAEDMIKNCLPCQCVSHPDPPKPLKMSKFPPGPWHTLC